MSDCWKNTAFFVVIIYLIVALAIDRSKYAACAKPIQIWYIGFLGLLLILRVALIVMKLVTQAHCIWAICYIIVGPLNIVFVLAWNILGSVFLGYILTSDKRAACMQTTEIVFDITVQCVIYLLYLVALLGLVLYLRSVRKRVQKNTELKDSLDGIYKAVVTASAQMSSKKLIKARTEIVDILKSPRSQVEKVAMLDSEVTAIKRFFRPRTGNRLYQPRVSEDSVEPYRYHTNHLSQPLLEIDNSTSQNHEMPMTQNRTNPDKQECIICYDDLGDESSTVVFGCGHQFHEVCILEWLETKPTCPLCRDHFRVGLLEAILEFLDGRLGTTGHVHGAGGNVRLPKTGDEHV